jgi:hypothetical protein
MRFKHLEFRRAKAVTADFLKEIWKSSMKVGNLVLLRGTMHSSYGRQGEIGLVIETKLMINRNGYPDAEFSRVMWSETAAKIYKTEHLEVVNESR